jgi:hypothetical protein
MKRIIEYRKMFDITADADLNTLKLKYRSLMKEWHPDKFSADDEKFAEAIEPFKQFYSNILFIEPKHKYQYSGLHQCDKLLVLYK